MKGGNKSSNVTAFTGSQTYSTSNNQQNVQMCFTRGFIPFWAPESVAMYLHGKKGRA